jgi:hypothetical protein
MPGKIEPDGRRQKTASRQALHRPIPFSEAAEQMGVDRFTMIRLLNHHSYQDYRASLVEAASAKRNGLAAEPDTHRLREALLQAGFSEIEIALANRISAGGVQRPRSSNF